MVKWKLQINRYIFQYQIPYKEYVPIATYNDHRMAMAFAPLALKTPIVIEDAEVVSKSYPTFWEDLESIGFKITK